MDLASLQAIATAITQEREVATVLRMIVKSLAAQPDMALARIWLIDRGDICATCPMREECPDQTRCLHLTASAGKSRENGKEWTRIDGEFRRFPMNVRKVGVVGATGDALLQRGVSQDPLRQGSKWIARPECGGKESTVSAVNR
jgi:hypothetical protein